MMSAPKLDKILSDDTILVDTAGDSCIVVHHRENRKIGYVEPVLGANADIQWTELEHGQNVLCHARGFRFGYDISHGALHAFRVSDLKTEQVLYDAPIAEKTLAVHLSPSNELFYSTTAGTVCFWHEGLKFEHSLIENEQAVALEYCVPDKGVLALTNNHIFLVHGHRGLLFRLRIPELAPPPSIKLQIDVSKDKCEEIELPAIDKKDVVWQLRAFTKFLVILTQNRIVISTGQGKWHILNEAPGMMDVIEAPGDRLCFLHISGNVMMMETKTFQVEEVLYPREPVVGRKLDADSHRMMRAGDYIFVGHLEGIIDRTPK